MTRRIANGMGWVIAWRVATRNLGLVSTLVLVRLLDPSDFGLIALATAFANTVDALSALGVPDALLRMPSPDRDTYDSAFGIGVVRGLVTALIIAGGAWPAAAFFNEPRLAIVLLMLALGTMITALENIGVVDFRRHMTFQKEFHLQVVGRIIGVGVTIASAWIWHSYWALVAGIMITRIVRLVQSYIMSPYRPGFTLRAWRSLIGFSIWSWAVTLALQIRDRADNFVIGQQMTTADVASFSVGQEIGALPITEIVEPLNRTLFSAFVLLNHDDKDPRSLFLNVIEAALMVVMPAGVGISLVADPVVHLMLGERWISVIPIVQILAIVGTLSVFGTVAASFNTAAGRLRTNFSLLAVSVALRVPLLVVLVHTHGLVGGAIALCISTAVDQLLILALTAHGLRITAGALLVRLWRTSLACGAMVLALAWAGWAWTPTPSPGSLDMAADMVERSASGAAVYVLSLLVLWFASGRPAGVERTALTAVGHGIRRIGRLVRLV